ncbi:MAG: PspA/IM30 family protein [Deltaproteobacteria bacterium]|nr:PspA/IM30 family protein [Deltaproteobacteria bacterium]
MGAFTRFRDIVNANMNTMLDRAEDPEKMIRFMIQEMEDTLVEIKASCAGAIAHRKKVEQRQEEARARADMWNGKAELAVEKGREDLAREALMEKKRWQKKADSLEDEAQQSRELNKQYCQDIAQLEEKLNAARDKQRILLQRHIHADRKKRAQEEIRRVENSEAWVRFEQFESRVERMEAEADLVNAHRPATVEDEISKLVRDEEIEKELEALKAKAGQRAG